MLGSAGSLAERGRVSDATRPLGAVLPTETCRVQTVVRDPGEGRGRGAMAVRGGWVSYPFFIDAPPRTATVNLAMGRGWVLFTAQDAGASGPVNPHQSH